METDLVWSESSIEIFSLYLDEIEGQTREKESNDSTNSCLRFTL